MTHRFDAIDDRPDPFADRRVHLPRRQMTDAEMDITPMIDVTFLLLIFFLVASRIDQDVDVALPPAKNGTAITSKTATAVTVTADDDDMISLFRGPTASIDQRIEVDSVPAQDREIRDYVQNELDESGKQEVLIRADRKVKHREISRIMKAIGQVEGVSIYLAVYEES